MVRRLIEGSFQKQPKARRFVVFDEISGRVVFLRGIPAIEYVTSLARSESRQSVNSASDSS